MVRGELFKLPAPKGAKGQSSAGAVRRRRAGRRATRLKHGPRLANVRERAAGDLSAGHRAEGQRTGPGRADVGR